MHLSPCKEACLLFIQRGFNLFHHDHDHVTPFFCLAKLLDLDILQAMIDAKADVNQLDPKHGSVLHAIITWSRIQKADQVKVAKLLSTVLEVSRRRINTEYNSMTPLGLYLFQKRMGFEGLRMQLN